MYDKPLNIKNSSKFNSQSKVIDALLQQDFSRKELAKVYLSVSLVLLILVRCYDADVYGDDDDGSYNRCWLLMVLLPAVGKNCILDLFHPLI